MKLSKGFLPALLVTLLLVVYMWAISSHAISLIRTGDVVGITIGIAIFILIPGFVGVLVFREWFLAAQVQAMADELASLDELPKDELPRSPGGRIDRTAADAAFLEVRELVADDPTNWKNWYHLAFAYEAAGDRSRARRSLRKAASLRRALR